MNKIKTWLKNEFINGYTLFERIFFLSMIALQIIVYCFMPDSLIGMICGLAGVICVALTAKGRISSYIFNFIQILTYLVICWQYKLYLEFGENIFYFFTCIVGIFLWKRNSQKQQDGTTQIKAKKLKWWHWLVGIVTIAISTFLLGYFGQAVLGSSLPYYDALTNILAIVAQLLMIYCYREQWVCWVVIDITCLIMFSILGNWSMIAMYVAWTVNAIYGWINWSKNCK